MYSGRIQGKEIEENNKFTMKEMMESMVEMLKYLTGWAGESGFSSRSTAEQVMQHYHCPHADPLTAIITGATSGIGFETARVMASRGLRLVLPARNVLAAHEAKARILSLFPDAQIILLTIDLSSFRSIRKFVSDFISLNMPLNLLINNAGKYSPDHAISEDGIEITFATNYLGHYLLTKLLLEKMVETARHSGIEGRIVNVTSNFHKWFSGDIFSSLVLMTKHTSKYDGGQAYALSKLATVLHTKELALRLKEMKNANVRVNCVNPGIARTRITRDSESIAVDIVFFLAGRLFKTIPQAAATTCYVATDRRLVGISGRYFSDCNEASTSQIAPKLSVASRLRTVSDVMVSTVDPNIVFDN